LSGKYRKALIEVKKMERMVITVPKEAEYFFRVALEAEQKESPTKVLEYFDRAITMEPGYVPAWNEKANYLDLIERYDEALECYNAAIRIDPGMAEAWFNKGLTLKKMGRDEDAAVCINRGIELAVGY
jgi:tetratricopeptide (TPR) repeat protein